MTEVIAVKKKGLEKLFGAEFFCGFFILLLGAAEFVLAFWAEEGLRFWVAFGLSLFYMLAGFFLCVSKMVELVYYKRLTDVVISREGRRIVFAGGKFLAIEDITALSYRRTYSAKREATGAITVHAGGQKVICYYVANVRFAYYKLNNAIRRFKSEEQVEDVWLV